MWTSHGHLDADERPTWTEAYEGTQRASLADRELSKVPRLIGDAKPEFKRDLVQRLVEDPDVQDDWDTRAKVQRAINVGEERQEQRRKEVVSRDPAGRTFESWDAGTELSKVVGQFAVACKQYSDAVDNAMLRDPSIDWARMSMLPQALERLASQYIRAGETTDRIRGFVGLGRSDIDTFLADVLKSGA